MKRHLAWVRRRVARSRRARVGALLLSLLLLPTLFADLVSSAAPLLVVGSDGISVLPGVSAPERYEGRRPAGILADHEDDWVLWAPLRHGPESLAPVGPRASPSLDHPLGTDARGHDVLSRLLHGGRVALLLALLAVSLASAVGIVLGSVAGYAGGFWDELLSRPVELVDAVPTVVVVAVAQAVAPEASALALVLAIAAVRWAEVARLVRAEVVRANEEDFVPAALAIGCGPVRVVGRHVLPMALRPVTVSAMFGVASVVVLEVAMSFLGIGVEGSWGVMIAEGLSPRTPMVVPVSAGLALSWTVLSSYLLADALGETLDARVATTSPRRSLLHPVAFSGKEVGR